MNSARMASLKDGVAGRKATLALVVLCMFMLLARRTGEPDRAESRAITTVRAIVSGELVYASINDGHVVPLKCLADPSCNPSINGQPYVLDPELAATPERHGYRFEFHAGPRAEGGSNQRRSRSSMTRFAVIAVPSSPESPRRRAFCGDNAGFIYYTRGTVPRVEEGRCLDTGRSIASSRWPAERLFQ